MSKTLPQELRQQRLSVNNRLRGDDEDKRPIPAETVIEIFCYLAANSPKPGAKKPPTLANILGLGWEVMPIDDLYCHLDNSNSADNDRLVGLIQAAIWRSHRFMAPCLSFEDGLDAGQIRNRFEPEVASRIRNLHLYYLLYRPSQLLEQEIDQLDRNAEMVERGALLENFPRDEEEAEKIARAMPHLRTITLSLLSFSQLDRSNEHSFPHRHGLPKTLELMIESGILQMMVRCVRIILLSGKTGTRKRAYLEINPEHDVDIGWIRVDMLEGNVEATCGKILEAAADAVHLMEREDYENEQSRSSMSD